MKRLLLVVCVTTLVVAVANVLAHVPPEAAPEYCVRVPGSKPVTVEIREIRHVPGPSDVILLGEPTTGNVYPVPSQSTHCLWINPDRVISTYHCGDVTITLGACKAPEVSSK